MCSENDCRIFRGRIQACDGCRTYATIGNGAQDHDGLGPAAGGPV